MPIARVAGAAGLGFVLVLLVANAILVWAGLPTPSERVGPDDVTAAYDGGRGALRAASALLPAAWLLATLFAAGMFAHHRHRAPAWALVGVAGVLMQSVTFAAVEATRLAVASAAVHAPATVAGLWALHTALFGFNQVFLATALLGLTVSGVRTGGMARWHAGVGLLGAALLFASATASPFGVDGVNPLALAGLVGWLLWLVWIVAHSLTLLGRTGADDTAAVSPAR